MRKIVRFITSIYILLFLVPVALTIEILAIAIGLVWLFSTVAAYWWMCVPPLRNCANQEVIDEMLDDGETLLICVSDLADQTRATLVSAFVLLFLRKKEEEPPVESTNVVEGIVDQMIEIPKK